MACSVSESVGGGGVRCFFVGPAVNDTNGLIAMVVTVADGLHVIPMAGAIPIGADG